jgi:hypothetical protein
MGPFRRFGRRCNIDPSSIWLAQIAPGSRTIVTTLRKRLLTSSVCSRSVIRFVPCTSRLRNTALSSPHLPSISVPRWLPQVSCSARAAHQLGMHVTFINTGHARFRAHTMPRIQLAHCPCHPRVPAPCAGALPLASCVRAVIFTSRIRSAPFAPCARGRVARLACAGSESTSPHPCHTTHPQHRKPLLVCSRTAQMRLWCVCGVLD